MAVVNPAYRADYNNHIIPVDIYKQLTDGATIHDISDYYNARQGDNETPLMIRYYKNYVPVSNVNGFYPFVEGNTGTPDEVNNLNNGNSYKTTWYGKTSDIQEGGLACLRLPAAFFPTTGVFVGHFGLMNDQTGRRYTTADVTFKVEGDGANMYIDTAPYRSDWQAFIDQAKQDKAATIQEIKDDYSNEIGPLKNQMVSLTDQAGKIQGQLNAIDFVGHGDFDKLSQEVQDQLKSGLEAAGTLQLNGSYDSAAALQAALPNGGNGLYTTTDTNHLYAWNTKDKTWSDLGGLGFGEQQKEDAYEYGLDQENFFNNSGLRIAGQTDPYKPIISSNVALSYVKEQDGYNWVRVRGTDNTSDYKGVRLDYDLSGNHSERYWIPASLDFILRSYEPGENQYRVDVVFDLTDGTKIAKNVSAFTASYNLNTNISLVAPSASQLGADQSMIASAHYNIWSDRNDGVDFKVTGARAKVIPENDVDQSPDSELSNNSLIKNADLKRGYSFGPYAANLSSVETAALLPNSWGKNWVSFTGDETTPWKGSRTYFDSEKDGNQYLNKHLTGLVRSSVAGESDYSLVVVYTTAAGSQSLVIDKVHLGAYTTRLDYVIPSAKSVGITAPVTSAHIELVTSKADHFYMQVTEWKISNLSEIDARHSDNIFALSDLSGNYNLDMVGSLGMTRSVASWGGDPWVEFKSDPMNSQDWQGAWYHYRIKDSSMSAKIGFDVVPKNLKTKSFLVTARYEWLDTSGQKQTMSISLATVKTDLMLRNGVRGLTVPSPDSQGLTGVSTVTIILNPSNRSDKDLDFLISNVHGSFEQMSPQTLATTDLHLIPSSFGLRYGKSSFNGTAADEFTDDVTHASWRGAWYGYQSDLVAYTHDATVDFKFINSAPLATRLLLSARYDSYDASGTQESLKTIYLGSVPVTGGQTLIKGIKIPSPRSQGFASGAVDHVTLIINPDNHATAGVHFWIQEIRGTLYDDSAVDASLDKQRLPVVSLQGDFDSMTADNKVMMGFKYQDHTRTIAGYSKTNWQGDSSTRFPEKNFKLKLYSDSDGDSKMKIVPSPTYVPENEFNLKVNWIQPQAARNLIVADLVREMTAARKSLDSHLAAAPNYGQVQGFPVIIMLNGLFYGLGTFNTSKSDVLFGIDEDDPKQFAIEGWNTTAANCFNSSSARIDSDDSTADFSLESDGDVTDEMTTSVNAMLKFVHESNDSDFKAGIEDYYDVDSAIDWQLIMEAAGLADEQAKNIIHVTYDGKKFHALNYDLDISWGSGWLGNNPTDNAADYLGKSQSNLLNRIVKLFPERVKARYSELKTDGILTTKNIQGKFRDFVNSVGEENYEADHARWPDKTSYDTISYQQTMRNIKERMDNLDKRVAALG
ncbi:CotH kinase family protein [Lactobacillus selangorensis]|nr:CotH kinase family protein [Lactobacillus selangorensis]